MSTITDDKTPLGQRLDISWFESGNFVLFIKRLQRFLNDDQIVSVIETLEETCNHCWDSHNDCSCWNDE